MVAELDLTAPSPVGRGVDWEAVYVDQMPRVFNFIRYRIQDDAVAEDLTAVTLEKAWRHRHRYRRDRGAFSTWLFTIARNVVIDYYRGPQATVSLDAVPPPPPNRRSVEDELERHDDRQRLGRLLSQLPTREQELIAFKYGAGLTNRAIARLVGLSETNVGTILHRVVGRLRAQWEQEA
jgi:RNA polymerase sigma-70 factor, ECF subfamily